MTETTITSPPPARVARAAEALHDQVHDLLAELDRDHPDTIAYDLADADLVGLAGTVMHPVCRWLLAKLDDDDRGDPAHEAWMSHAGVHVLAQPGSVEAVVALPPAVAVFAAAWDRGHYPELQLDIPATIPLAEPVHEDPALAQCVACGCSDAAACVTELAPVNGQAAWTSCRWATPDEIAAAGHSPMEVGELCTSCLATWIHGVERARAKQEFEAQWHAAAGRPVTVLEPAVVGRATPRDTDTATIPAVPAAAGAPAGDGGRVLVHTAVLSAHAAVAAFAGAVRAFDVAVVVGGLALAWLVVSGWRGRRRRPGGYSALHPAGRPPQLTDPRPEMPGGKIPRRHLAAGPTEGRV